MWMAATTRRSSASCWLTCGPTVYKFNTPYKTSDGVFVLRDMVVNGHSLNFTKTTDENGNTKLIWGNYENRTDGTPQRLRYGVRHRVRV